VTGPAVLVTGASGFIGRARVRRLLGAGRPVVALARRRNSVSAAARVRAALGGAPRHLEVVEADLEAPDLGLDPTALDPGFTAAYALAGNVLYEVPGFLGGDVKEAEAMFRKGRRLLDALGERS